MDLKDFVSQALIQITEGVCEAQAVVQDKGGCVNPALRKSDEFQAMHDARVIQSVDFNVAVTATEDSSSSGGGTLSVASIFKANAETSSSEKNSITSHISFKVQIALPVDPVSLKELEHEESINRESKNKTIKNTPIKNHWS